MGQIAMLITSLLVGATAGAVAGAIAFVGGYLAALLINEAYHRYSSGTIHLGQVSLVTMPGCALVVGRIATLAIA